jgi:hypothetical protein
MCRRIALVFQLRSLPAPLHLADVTLLMHRVTVFVGLRGFQRDWLSTDRANRISERIAQGSTSLQGFIVHGASNPGGEI